MTLEVKLPAPFKAEWLAALRSGDYKQGQNYLKTRDGMCCLGVACDIRHKGEANYWRLSSGGHYETPVRSYAYPHEQDLGPEIYAALDQNVDEENAPFPPVRSFLAAHNDGENGMEQWNFHQIADWIEANL